MKSRSKFIHAEEFSEFEFSSDNLKKVKNIIKRYPAKHKMSAVMPLLTMAQQECDNYLPKAAMDYIANMLSMPLIKVYEVASFYSMYNLEPVGKHVIEVCTTTPCWLRKSHNLVEVLSEFLDIKVGETSKDKNFTLREVECLGACVNAPVMKIGDNYYEDLDEKSVIELIKDLCVGKEIKAGVQINRLNSAPISLTSKGNNSIGGNSEDDKDNDDKDNNKEKKIVRK